jgi:hypothetical protein
LLTTLEEGVLLKPSRWGVAWKQGRIEVGDDSAEAAGLGGGLPEETGNHRQPRVGSKGKHTLGGSWGDTLGRAGSG